MKKIMCILGSILLTGTLAAAYVFGSSTAAGSAEDNTTIRQSGEILSSQKNQENTILLTAVQGVNDDVQLVEVKIEPFSYPEITVESGRPVRINFKVDSADELNVCNNEIIIPSLNITKTLEVGDNFVEFTPTREGTISYSCWMDMIRSQIVVKAAGVQSSKPQIPESETPRQETGLSGDDVKSFQESTVSVDGDITSIEAKIAAGGYPQIVVEANKPVRVNFKADASDLNSCNNEIIIPEWNIRITLSAGDNYVEFTPTKTGTFNYSCWMGMIQSSISVIEQDSGAIGALPMDESANQQKSCCSGGNGSSGKSSRSGGMMGGGGCCGR